MKADADLKPLIQPGRVQRAAWAEIVTPSAVQGTAFRKQTNWETKHNQDPVLPTCCRMAVVAASQQIFLNHALLAGPSL